MEFALSSREPPFPFDRWDTISKGWERPPASPAAPGGRVVSMKVLLAILMLALAALAVPSSQAALGAPCQVNQSNDTVCHVEAAGCSVDTYSYDVEDALNHYQASCLCVHYDNYGRPALRQTCYSPPPIASSAAAAPELPLETHCWSAEFGSGCSTTATTAAAVCTHSSWTSTEGVQSADLACSNASLGSCSIGLLPATDPPAAWCSGPAAGGSLALAADLPSAGDVCQAGIAQTWCDVTVGPCDVRIVPWTAWGDQYVVADCRIGGGAGATCHTEVHTQDPLDPVHWCAF